MRRYNIEYSTYRDIDYFFRIGRIPIYVSSRGTRIDARVKVQLNALLQDVLYSEMSLFAEEEVLEGDFEFRDDSYIYCMAADTIGGQEEKVHWLSPEGYDCSFYSGFMLSGEDYSFDIDAIKFFLLNEFNIANPTPHHVFLVARSVLPMVSRGFVCVLPIRDKDDPDTVHFRVIAYPNERFEYSIADSLINLSPDLSDGIEVENLYLVEHLR